MFANPEALAYFNDSILVVDSMNKNLVVFEYTHLEDWSMKLPNYIMKVKQPQRVIFGSKFKK